MGTPFHFSPFTFYFFHAILASEGYFAFGGYLFYIYVIYYSKCFYKFKVFRCMKVYNSTKNNLIAGDVKLANNFVTRSLGLLPKSSISEDEGLTIKPCCSVHTFFMRFPIDVLFVDRQNRIVALYENVGRNRVLPIHLNSFLVIELAAGQISRKNIEKYDIILCVK